MSLDDEPIDTNYILVRSQIQALREISRIVYPWMEQTPFVKLPSLVLKNENVQSAHLTVAVEGGSLEIVVGQRTRDPSPETIVIPPGESLKIDLNDSPRGGNVDGPTKR